MGPKAWRAAAAAILAIADVHNVDATRRDHVAADAAAACLWQEPLDEAQDDARATAWLCPAADDGSCGAEHHRGHQQGDKHQPDHQRRHRRRWWRQRRR